MKPGEDREDDEKENKFRCTEELCTMKYLTISGLQNHLLLGKHKKLKHSDTIVEAGLEKRV